MSSALFDPSAYPGTNVRLVPMPLEQPINPQPWRDREGNTWVPGEVTPSGDIVSNPGIFVTKGIVYIHKSQLDAALAAGWWQWSATAPNGLVQVKR